VLHADRHHEAESIFANGPKGGGGGQKPQLFTPWSLSISFVPLTDGLPHTVPVTLHSTLSTTQPSTNYT
jgi:hypothetical protein